MKIEKIALAVDFLLFTIEEYRLKILLVNRSEEPFKGMLALPGVSVKEDEPIEAAARRSLKEETGITSNIYMEQLYTWGDNCNRDPRCRVVSISYIALIPRENINISDGERVSDIAFYDVEELLQKGKLAFDHMKILSYGRERIRNKTEYSDIAFNLMPDEFTLPELQRVYEILLGKKLFKANFRKSIKEKVIETGKMKKGMAHRPSLVYRRREM